MRYQKNVQSLCSELGVENPIQEKDLTIKSLSFLIDGTWWLVPGSELNKAGRLFFQAHVSPTRTVVALNNELGNEPRNVLKLARLHFAEYWDDAEKVGRSMIVALKRATQVEVHWKE